MQLVKAQMALMKQTPPTMQTTVKQRKTPPTTVKQRKTPPTTVKQRKKKTSKNGNFCSTNAIPIRTNNSLLRNFKFASLKHAKLNAKKPAIIVCHAEQATVNTSLASTVKVVT